MADNENETPIVAADIPVDVGVEAPVGAESNGVQPEQTVEQAEHTVVKQEEIEAEPAAIVKQEETEHEPEQVVDIKQEETAEVKQEEAETPDVKKEEITTNVKQEENGAAADVKKEYKGKRPFVKKENLSKFDPTVLPDSDDPEEIRKQVEFYFSESNLSSDKFLFGLVGGKENKPVPLNLIVSFKRMKRFPNKETVVNALKDSTVVELGGGAGEETVKRKIPLEITELIPFERRYDNNKIVVDFQPNQDPTIYRSIYAKGFTEETATTQFDLEKFFEPYGPINAVRLRRDNTKCFKRSIFVEFANEELAQNFMALDPKPTWKDQELMWLSKLAYVEMKVQAIKEGKIQAKSRDVKDTRDRSRQNKHHGSRGNDKNGRGGGRGRSNGNRGGRGGRGGRGNHRDNRRSDRDGGKKEDNGIPKLKSSTSPVKSEPTGSPTQNGGVKRKAADEITQEVKKPKVEETATA